MEFIFAKTTILHIDPVFSIIKDEDSYCNQPNFTCPLCSKTFPEPLRLKRHLLSCKTNPSLQSDIKTFLPKSTNTAAMGTIIDNEATSSRFTDSNNDTLLVNINYEDEEETGTSEDEERDERSRNREDDCELLYASQKSTKEVSGHILLFEMLHTYQ